LIGQNGQYSLETGLERLAQDESSLGRGTFSRIDDEKNSVDHREHSLDLSSKVSVTGGVDDAMNEQRVVKECNAVRLADCRRKEDARGKSTAKAEGRKELT
jgi:hypothetical protein